MKIIYSQRHLSHSPLYEIFNGHADPHAEVPSRVENIKKALITNGYKISSLSKTAPISLIKRVHDKKYLEFLKKGSPYSYPSVFPYNDLNKNKSLTNELANHGKYSFDLYTPMLKGVFETALESASLAYELADDLLHEKIKIGYALCRPPGHHAEKAKMGGYCYLNNSAIAAEHLSCHGKVAILDVDFHHGNGTQNIFYDRADVLTISIHADPEWKFPYFTGFSHETGIGKGKNKNFNFPMKKGTTDSQFQIILEKAIKKITDFEPKYLVVPLGLDTHKDDPIGGFKLTTNYYKKMARTINFLKLPALIVQEGGYNTSLLGNNVVSFLNGFI
ncbi:MAG: Histone deacetylase superfamily [Microgenomates group bacterium GW2011_GWC2_46_7]|uniref:Histone deacetylase superfamily n=1 Tax=Candidatus Roizmanbacteria bacterium GW2011_GWA2_35_8 TaxID=1618479 RepID=A0A0G0CZA0_9BACT|nr:MAG: Histone deacetylase superfamily [Candidatus Roizmanbacteria bacterium GW2011_GWA2_35_8]KKU45273.1 MAG: Histone deacetylase superfamily [Microgenomates group bacterium GW2011_GWC2_46_7]